MSVVNIERSQGLSALKLISAVEGLAGASLLAQARAMVVERQPGAAPFSTDRTSQAMLSVRQAQLRARARQLLDELLPVVFSDVTGMQSFALLLQTAQEEARRGGEDVAEALLDALITSARECEQGSATLAAKATAAATQAAEEQAELDNVITAEVHRLDGTEEGDDEGELAQVRAQIAKTSEDMSAAVQATVDSSRKVGAGVRRIVTWVSSLFSFQSGDTPRKPEKDDDGTDGEEASDGGGEQATGKVTDKVTSKDKGKDKGKDEATDGGKPRIKPERPTQDFPVETIGEIGDDTAATFDARTKLNSLVVQQRVLYFKLYRAEAGLALMQVVGQQGSDLVAALRTVGSSADAVRAEWERLATECEQAKGNGLPFDDSWTRLVARTEALLKPFVSSAGAMPRLTDIDSPTA
jgi:hypothetical protein